VSVRRWIEGWERAWNSRDPGPIDELYTEDCVFRSHPFREPEDPREYVRRVLPAEEEVEARFAEPVVDGERAAVEWWATLIEEGEEVTLVGCSILRFAPDGRCSDQRDYWAITPGRRPPPEGWRRSTI
jgi:hypothetical protein